MIAAAEYCQNQRSSVFRASAWACRSLSIEFARNVCGWKDANSREFDPDSNYRVIDFLPDQNDEIHKGGTLRLGAYPCQIKEGSRMMQCYGKHEIHERHRHRYEFNNDFRDQLETAGLCISGTSPDGHIDQRPWRSAIIHSTSAYSSTRNSRAAPTVRTPCSAGSSTHRCRQNMSKKSKTKSEDDSPLFFSFRSIHTLMPQKPHLSSLPSSWKRFFLFSDHSQE